MSKRHNLGYRPTVDEDCIDKILKFLHENGVSDYSVVETGVRGPNDDKYQSHFRRAWARGMINFTLVSSSYVRSGWYLTDKGVARLLGLDT